MTACRIEIANNARKTIIILHNFNDSRNIPAEKFPNLEIIIHHNQIIFIIIANIRVFLLFYCFDKFNIAIPKKVPIMPTSLIAIINSANCIIILYMMIVQTIDRVKPFSNVIDNSIITNTNGIIMLVAPHRIT